MGNYLLCKRPPAVTPFYIESIHLNIYSLEELCYFLSTNPAIADEVITDGELSEWLENECGVTGIREYNALPVSKEKVGTRLYWIFVKSHYFSENELRRLKVKIDALDTMRPMERQKQKADTLLRFGKYRRCIDCYEEVFRIDGVHSMPSFFKAGVYHNMGYAYLQLFQSKRALECFKKACKADGSDEFRDAYIKAVYFDGGAEKMEKELERLKADKEYAERIRTEISQVKGKTICDDPDTVIGQWIKQYHLSVDM